MKYFFILIVSLASCAVFGQAQVSIGLKGGLNFANLDADGFNTKSRTGYHIGGFALFKLTKIGIQPEIIFSQQGSEVKSSGNTIESNFSYVNIPVLLKLYTVLGINFQIGPQFGFLTSAEYDDDNVKNNLKNSDLSLALGAGWDLPFRLTVDARYNLGLSDVNDDLGEADVIKNQVWQISVGYKLFKFGD